MVGRFLFSFWGPASGSRFFVFVLVFFSIQIHRLMTKQCHVPSKPFRILLLNLEILPFDFESSLKSGLPWGYSWMGSSTRQKLDPPTWEVDPTPTWKGTDVVSDHEIFIMNGSQGIGNKTTHLYIE